MKFFNIHLSRSPYSEFAEEACQDFGENNLVQVPFEESGPLTIAQAIYLSGLFPPPALCSGLGRCGKCRVRYLSASDFCDSGISSSDGSCLAHIPEATAKEEEILGLEAIANGWRLGCLHPAEPGLSLELPPFVKLKEQEKKVIDKEILKNGAKSELKLAIDFGSTSICSSLYREDYFGETQSIVNPQMGAGSDIMSRLAFAAGNSGAGAKCLQDLSVEAIQTILNQGFGGAGEVKKICLAANPAMTMLLLGKDSSGLASAPYTLGYPGGCYEKLANLPDIWVAPLISPFIGGDISAGYAALAMNSTANAPYPKAEYPFLLADLGTNGEFVLALEPDLAFAASIPLGPALEGIGLSFGTEAGPGAITSFNMTPFGVVPVFFGEEILPDLIPGAPKRYELPVTRGSDSDAKNLHTQPRGITGTGYLSLLSSLRKSRLLTADGHFAAVPELAAGLGKMLSRFMVKGIRNRKRFSLPHNMYLDAADVEELLKVKASFSLALKILLQEASIKFSDLRHVFIAGAMGMHVSVPVLEGLGFLPAGAGGKVKAVGNTSLEGAKLLLEKAELREELVAWTKKVRTINLTEYPNFMHDFAQGMNFDRV